MEPKLVDAGEMVIVGIAEKGAGISALWERFVAVEDLISNKVEGAGYELHMHPSGEYDWKDVTVMVGVQVTEAEDLPEGVSVKVLPPSLYAVFTHRLGDGGYEGANDDMNAWLDIGPYKMSRRVSVQRFDSRFKDGTAPDSEIDFLLPVVLKE
jgi:AraC family transcriptional regulator